MDAGKEKKGNCWLKGMKTISNGESLGKTILGEWGIRTTKIKILTSFEPILSLLESGIKKKI